MQKGETLVKKIRGAESVEQDPLTALRKSPVLDVMLNPDSINRYGVTMRDVNHAFEIAMTGQEAGIHVC